MPIIGVGGRAQYVASIVQFMRERGMKSHDQEFFMSGYEANPTHGLRERLSHEAALDAEAVQALAKKKHPRSAKNQQLFLKGWYHSNIPLIKIHF